MTRRRLWLFVLGVSVALLVALLVRFLYPVGGSQPPVTLLTTELPCIDPPQPVGIEDATRTASMLSVHANAYDAAGMILPSDDVSALQLPALADTVSILAWDTHPLAKSRARRAAAKLAAYANETNSAELDLAWRQVLRCKRLLIEKVRTQLQTPRPLPAMESAVYAQLTSLSPDGCEPRDAKFATPVSSPSGVATRFEFIIAKDATDLARRVDPQSWDNCSALFLEAYPTTAPGTVSTVCPIPSTYADPLPEDPNVHPPGTRYSSKLFEDFECPQCNSRFKNLLTVNTVVNGPTCAMVPPACGPTVTTVAFEGCYGLADPNDSLTGCYGTLPLKITRDQGELTVCNSTSGGPFHLVVSRKDIGFNAAVIDDVLYAYMLISTQEATEMLVEMVCC